MLNSKSNDPLHGVTLGIDIYEKSTIVKKEPDRFGLNQQDYIPNGKLVLRIKDSFGTFKE